jgi:hypothetical protein
MSLEQKQKYFRSVGYAPHSTGQAEFHASQARFKLACCGRRFGKSYMAAMDLIPQLFQHDHRYWIVGPTYDLGEKEFRYVWNNLIIRQQLGRDKRIKKAYNKKQGEMYIEFKPWQTVLEVRSAQHPESLVGDALHGVIMSEAAKHKEDTWQRYIRPALSDFRGWGSFPSTPEGFNWFYELWERGYHSSTNTSALDSFESWTFPSWENRVIYPGGRYDPEILLLEKTTSVEWFAQEIGAEFTSFVGKIYGEFDNTVHVLDDYKFNPLWPNYMCFDWGFTKPLAAIEFQVSPWDEIFVWREHYKPYFTLTQHCQEIKARPNPEGYRLDLCFGDAADPGAALEVTAQLGVACLAEPEAKENWREGVLKVKEFLKVHEELEDVSESTELVVPIKRTRFYVARDCRNTLKEFNTYRRKETPGGKEERKDGPVDQNIPDHALDAIRYGIMHLYKLFVHQHLDPTDVQDWMRNQRTTAEDLVDYALSPEYESDSFFTYDGGMVSGMRF